MATNKYRDLMSDRLMLLLRVSTSELDVVRNAYRSGTISYDTKSQIRHSVVMSLARSFASDTVLKSIHEQMFAGTTAVLSSCNNSWQTENAKFWEVCASEDQSFGATLFGETIISVTDSYIKDNCTSGE